METRADPPGWWETSRFYTNRAAQEVREPDVSITKKLPGLGISVISSATESSTLWPVWQGQRERGLKEVGARLSLTRSLASCSLAPFPTARRAHQLFRAAAAAPIAGRPSAPNINDTRESGLEAQARGPTPTPAAPVTSTQHFSIFESNFREPAGGGKRKPEATIRSPLPGGPFPTAARASRRKERVG